MTDLSCSSHQHAGRICHQTCCFTERMLTRCGWFIGGCGCWGSIFWLTSTTNFICLLNLEKNHFKFHCKFYQIFLLPLFRLIEFPIDGIFESALKKTNGRWTFTMFQRPLPFLKCSRRIAFNHFKNFYIN